MANILINKALGLNTQPNELTAEPGSLAVAKNVEVTRDGVIEVSRGFEDFSTNLPDFTPSQLISVGGVVYLHLDDGLWYHDGTRWLRKRGAMGNSIYNPDGLVVVSGHLYVASSDHVIWDYNLSTGSRTVLAGRYRTAAVVDGTGGAARLYSPAGIVHDSGNLYVTDSYTVRKIVISTGVVSTLAGSGVLGDADGTGAAATFNVPRGIASDGTNLWVCGYNRNVIRKVTIAGGVVTTPIGVAGSADASTDGTGTAIRFRNPIGIVYDSGNLYVSDFNNFTIRKIVVSSLLSTTIAGVAQANGSTDGTGTAARFYQLGMICSDGTNIYIAERINNTIRKMTISGAVVTTVAGTALQSGSTDGITTAARFDLPSAVAVSGSDLYVSDTINCSIRRIYPSGYVTTLDGTTGSQAGFAPGLLSAAGFVAGPT